MRQVIAERPYRVPEWLRMVRCIGSFQRSVTPHHPDRHVSVLVAVWFQDEYGLPFLEPGLGQWLAADWDSLATDIDL